MNNIKIKNSQNISIIDIEGVIGVPEEWQFESPDQRVATYERFRDKLAQIEALESSDVVVNIRSTGGDVNDAILIYEALSSLSATITTRCYGYTASAATVIAQAASEGKREISANALYLIHCSTCMAEGNAQGLEQQIALLEKTDERLAELYARRSSKDVESFTALMSEDSGNGRWLTPDEVLESGLADKIIDASEVAPSAVQNLWRRIKDSLGIPPTSDVQAPLTHIPTVSAAKATTVEELQQHRSITEFTEGQKGVEPTALNSCEDPSISDGAKSQNQAAYDMDVKAFRR